MHGPGEAVANMSNFSSPTTHTNPAIIKPYAFPNPSSWTHATPIPAIDPRLNPSPPGRTRRTKYSAEDLEQLVRLAAEEEPWAKPHGQITNSWKEILERLQSEGHFQGSSLTTIQNKLNALLAWQRVCFLKLSEMFTAC